MIAQVSKSDATVLIRGESGTGKELVAQAIHYNSPRASKPLIKVNCAALPETVIESELFGHEKGSFTGAISTRKGRFELANGGTIFLDEIGDLSAITQVKLLRVLQEKEFERVGGNETIRTNVRVIAATNRNLEQMIAERQFREDLFYRLNVIKVDLPPLADRGGDVLLLAERFVEKYARKIGKDVRGIDRAAAARLTAYEWPGNVRELENIIERAIVLTSSIYLTEDDLVGLSEAAPASAGGEIRPLSEVERDHIRFCLDQLDWNLGHTAEKLGIHRNTLRAKIKDYGLTRPE
jgi:Nif-specific regulatory protein